MKLRFLSLLFLAGYTVCVGKPPPSLAGYIYYQRAITQDSGGVGPDVTAILCNSDGTYISLFNLSMRSRFQNRLITLYQGSDSTYTYSITDDKTAKLNVGFPIGTSFGERELGFDSELSGYIRAMGVSALSTGFGFWLAPLESRAPLSNCSNRCFVQGGGQATTGFVVTGEARLVLVRAVGAGLKKFGVSRPLANPLLTIIDTASNITLAQNDDWNSDSVPAVAPVSFLAQSRAGAIARVCDIVGAFPLEKDSKDSALVLYLNPGAYVAQASSLEPSDSGEVLIEVYLLP